MIYAKSTGAISNAWVDTALTVHNRVLSVPIANKWLEWCEEHLMSKNPWSSIYALQALVDRGRTPDRIGWAVWGMTDLLRVDAIDLSHFSVAKLKDYRNSYIEVMCLKQELHSFFIANSWAST